MRMTMTKWSLVVALTAGLLGSAWAAGPVATATSVEGRVTVERGEQRTPLATGGEILEGDRLRTAADGRVELAFVDGSRLTLTALGDLTVERYLWDEGQARQSLFAMASGRLRSYVNRFLSGGSAGENRFEVRTPTAVAGVRGTDFYTIVDPGEDGEGGDTEVYVEEGEVEVRPLDPDIGGAVVLLPGQLSRVLSGQAPSAPQAVGNEIRNRIRRLLDSRSERESQDRRELARESGQAPPTGTGGPGEPGEFGDDGFDGEPDDRDDDGGPDVPPFDQVPSFDRGGTGGGGDQPPLPPSDRGLLDIDVRIINQSGSGQ